MHFICRIFQRNFLLFQLSSHHQVTLLNTLRISSHLISLFFSEIFSLWPFAGWLGRFVDEKCVVNVVNNVYRVALLMRSLHQLHHSSNHFQTIHFTAFNPANCDFEMWWIPFTRKTTRNRSINGRRSEIEMTDSKWSTPMSNFVGFGRVGEFVKSYGLELN